MSFGLAAGSPGPFTLWCFRLVDHIARPRGLSDGWHSVANVSPFTPDTFGDRMGWTYFPSPDAVKSVLELRAPFFATVGDPEMDAVYLSHVENRPIAEVVRFMAHAGSSLYAIRAEGAEIISYADLATVGDAATALMRSLGWPVEWAMEHIDPSMPLFDALKETWQVGNSAGMDLPLSHPNANLVSLTAIPALEAAIDGMRRPITWPMGVFLSGDRPSSSAPAWMDAAGGARTLFCGPHIYVPPGDWVVEATLGFDGEFESSSFSLQISAGGKPLARARTHPHSAGYFAASFRLHSPTVTAPLEFILASEQSAISGRVGLFGVTFYPDDFGQASGRLIKGYEDATP